MSQKWVDDWVAFPHVEGILLRLQKDMATLQLPLPCFSSVLPGDLVALDYIGDDCDSMAYSRAVSAFPSISFPNPDSSPQPVLQLASSVELGLVRAFALPDNGEAPSADEQRAAARLQLADMTAMANAICGYCTDRGVPMVLGPYTPVGPGGGVVGGFWTATLAAV